MQPNPVKTIALSISLGILVVAYSFFRSMASTISFVEAFDLVTVTLIDNLWQFISTPTVFLGTLAFIIIWRFRSRLDALIPKLSALKAGDYVAEFKFPASQDATDPTPSSSGTASSFQETQVPASVTDWIVSRSGAKTSQLYLDIDGETISASDMIDRVARAGPYVAWGPAEMSARERRIFHQGQFAYIWTYALPALFVMVTAKDRSATSLALKPGVRVKLENSIRELKKQLAAAVQDSPGN
jgi:hypothetical protein